VVSVEDVMRTYCLVCLLAALLMSCRQAVARLPAPPVPAARGPMIDYEPEGEVPSFDRLHERVFEPHWL
jgi:hypothetical protein